MGIVGVYCGDVGRREDKVLPYMMANSENKETGLQVCYLERWCDGKLFNCNCSGLTVFCFCTLTMASW